MKPELPYNGSDDITFAKIVATDLDPLSRLMEEGGTSIAGLQNRNMYKAICRVGLQGKRLIFLVAKKEGLPVGYVIAAIDWTRFWRQFSLRHPVLAAQILYRRLWKKLALYFFLPKTHKTLEAHPKGSLMIPSAKRCWEQSSPTIAKIIEIRVSDAWRESGIGSQLYYHLFRELLKYGVSRVDAQIETWNLPSIRLHQKTGWTMESLSTSSLFATRDIAKIKSQTGGRLFIERLDMNRIPWDKLDGFADRTIFQTLPWINFVAQTQAAEPMISVLKENGNIIGYFSGLIFKKFGLKILGSPFQGWTTSYMGFNLLPGISRRSVLEALPRFAFEELKCHYLEIVDRYISEADYQDLSFSVSFQSTFEIDLTQEEDKLFANMSKSCRWGIRKAAKSGVVIEESNNGDFSQDYLSQLEDVFTKQSLVPTYGIERVRALVRNLYPTGNLLLLRARNPEGVCIATGIFPAFNNTMYFWGGASWRQYQKLCPNETIIWYAMKRWKSLGIKTFDLGGWSKYKRKYGGYEIAVPRLMKGRYNFLITLRNAAQQAWHMRQELLGKFKLIKG